MTHKRCPNCGRSLVENEVYCYFCDMEIEKLEEKHKDKNKK